VCHASSIDVFTAGHFYQIYNRGSNRPSIFFENEINFISFAFSEIL